MLEREEAPGSSAAGRNRVDSSCKVDLNCMALVDRAPADTAPADKWVVGKGAVDNRAADNQVADNQVADKQVADKQVDYRVRRLRHFAGEGEVAADWDRLIDRGRRALDWNQSGMTEDWPDPEAADRPHASIHRLGWQPAAVRAAEEARN